MTTLQVCALSGATPRQLQWWDERGYLSPQQDSHERTWDRADAEAAMLIIDLRKRGCTPRRAYRAAHLLVGHPQAKWIVIAGPKIRFCGDEAQLVEYLERIDRLAAVVRVRRCPEVLPEPQPRMARTGTRRSPGGRVGHYQRKQELSERDRRMTERAVGPMPPSQVFAQLLKGRQSA